MTPFSKHMFKMQVQLPMIKPDTFYANTLQRRFQVNNLLSCLESRSVEKQALGVAAVGIFLGGD